LSAKAAYRSGAGLVQIVTPDENRAILQMQLPEAILTTYQPDVLDKESERLKIIDGGFLRRCDCCRARNREVRCSPHSG
jgi:NAD(P)H-hydrate repair Nnr-like enzyme with NAD(P)H-hydrate dehydratase domain